MEHISHHPAISAFLIDNPNWCLHGTTLYNARIGLTSFDIFNEGWVTLKMKKSGQEYLIKYPEANIKGMVTGNRYFKATGNVVVINKKEKLKAVCNIGK